MDFLHVPRRLNPAIPDHAVIIYTFALAVLSGVVGTALSVPLWWPASKGWTPIYIRSGAWKSAALGIFFLFLTVDLPFAAVWAELNFGFAPVLRHFGSLKYVGYTYSDLNLFKAMAGWAGTMAVEAYVTSSFIGFCRYIYAMGQSKKGW